MMSHGRLCLLCLQQVSYNGALIAFKLGDFQESYSLVMRALDAYPEHTESHELLKQLKSHFTML